MKEFIQALLGKAGYEILRKNRPRNVSRNTMTAGLHWLKNQDFKVQTVFDVGASDGRWSKDCIKNFPNATYVLFEPQPVHSLALDEFAGSASTSVLPVKKAIGGEVGTMSFDISDPFGGGPAIAGSEDVMEVELTTIDATVSELNLADPFLLKLDTHGIERSILQGAEETLKKCEILIIEAYNYHITDEAMLFWELCAYLYQRGFRTVDLVDVMHRKHDNSLWQMDLFFVRSDWDGFNHIMY